MTNGTTTILDGEIHESPRGQVSLYADLEGGELRVYSDVNGVDADEWAWASAHIEAASAGQPVQSYEPYEEGADVLVVKIQQPA